MCVLKPKGDEVGYGEKGWASAMFRNDQDFYGMFALMARHGLREGMELMIEKCGREIVVGKWQGKFSWEYDCGIDSPIMSAILGGQVDTALWLFLEYGVSLEVGECSRAYGGFGRAKEDGVLDEAVAMWDTMQSRSPHVFS